MATRESDGGKQLQAVKFFMLRRKRWWYLPEIARATGYPATSIPAISARLRDLRKEKFGSYDVQKREMGDRTWQYLVVKKEE